MTRPGGGLGIVVGSSCLLQRGFVRRGPEMYPRRTARRPCPPVASGPDKLADNTTRRPFARSTGTSRRIGACPAAAGGVALGAIRYPLDAGRPLATFGLTRPPASGSSCLDARRRPSGLHPQPFLVTWRSDGALRLKGDACGDCRPPRGFSHDGAAPPPITKSIRAVYGPRRNTL
jgi:hypothetical protein